MKFAESSLHVINGANWVDVPLGRLEQDQRPIDPVPVPVIEGWWGWVVTHAGQAERLGLGHHDDGDW